MLPRFHQVIGFALLACQFAACAVATPLPRRTSLKERLEAFPSNGVPLTKSVVIYWNNHQVPFIEAGTDADLATSLGLVHAHLRLAQMEMIRRLAKGRLAEMIGPLGFEVDRLMLILDLGRAVPEILTSLPDDTRHWLQAFVNGVNHHLYHAPELPHEFRLLKLKREPWTVADILTIGRLAAVDVNWPVWCRLLKLRRRKTWPSLWSRLLGGARLTHQVPTLFSPSGSHVVPLPWLAQRASNSIAIASSRSASSGAMLASDPHLWFRLPSAWLIVGYRSPSHQAVGFMTPGLPFVALGRNPWIAWGGANLHAASSDFVDVSDLPQNAITERREVIKVRWYRERPLVIRNSAHGPIISDAPILGLDRHTPIALRWMGHRPSDEFTAMLKVNQARNWDEFRAALEGIVVSGQAMTYADIEGHIGRALAVKLPVRAQKTLPDLLVKSSTSPWHTFVSGADLTAIFQPEGGFAVSANERPDETTVPIGFFFSPPDRAQRLAELIACRSKLDREALMEVLNDVCMATSMHITRRFLAALSSEKAVEEDRRASRLVTALAEWDGNYDGQSRGALAFELVFYNFVRAFYSKDELNAYWATWAPRTFVREDLSQCGPDAITFALKQAIRHSVGAFERFGTWGEMHRLRLSHPFGLMPIFGRPYIYCDAPAAGGDESVLKSGHRFTANRHSAIFGSSARHVSDLSDPDANFFILAGGQDGWLGSSTYADQFGLWQRGGYIRIPLQPETIRTCFAHRLELLPQPGHL
jgi:penicillin amidase